MKRKYALHEFLKLERDIFINPRPRDNEYTKKNVKLILVLQNMFRKERKTYRKKSSITKYQK